MRGRGIEKKTKAGTERVGECGKRIQDDDEIETNKQADIKADAKEQTRAD